MSSMILSNDPKLEYCLRLGDNCLILAHRISEWIGHSPVLEEDLGLANVSLDLLGQAQNWLGLAAELEGKDHDADWLAFRRGERAFRNVLLVEQPNGDFAHTMVRQLYFDLWHRLVLEQLSASQDARIAEIAAKALKEVHYHIERSHDWTVRLGDGTAESHQRMQTAINALWMFTGELFEIDAVDETLQGIAADLSRLQPLWQQQLHAILDEATLTLPQENWTRRGGKQGMHSEHLGYLLAEMQFLQRVYPDARW